ncbi:MAG TPA: phosphate ABC transporter permease PstA [Acidimicrobiia bacterium]|nr:phosphate ABC transporter permease PstA [Acidimicrobiia bacterium]
MTALVEPPVRAVARIPEPSEERVRVRAVDPTEMFVIGGSAASALALTWLVYERLTPLSGIVGFWVCWYVAFVATVGYVSWQVHGALRARDQLARVVVWSGGVAVFVPLVLILVYVIGRGYHALRPQFFVEDQEFVGSLSTATEGGGAHAIVGTLQQVGLATFIAVPLGILSAIYLNEVRGRLARPLRMFTDAMSAVPSIVAGLFVYASWILALGNEQNGLAGALALAVLFLPTVTRTSEVVLRLVPGGLREAGLALGGTEARMVGQVVLPTARSGLATAVILGIARVIGETAPLILTIGGAFVMNANPLEGKQDALPYFVFRLVRLPAEAQIQRAWTGALVLVGLVLVLFVIARLIGGRGPDHIGRLRRWNLQRRGLA